MYNTAERFVLFWFLRVPVFMIKLGLVLVVVMMAIAAIGAFFEGQPADACAASSKLAAKECALHQTL